jgi:hypothetical protein
MGCFGTMFERFTDRARRVLVLAQDEARTLGHNFIGTEHLLLGLIDEQEGVAAKALESLGVDFAAVRERVDESVGPSLAASQGAPPFTPRAKKVLELGLREALQLGHNYIGTEHILLGLLREGEGVAIQVLIEVGVEPNSVRQAVFSVLRGASGSTSTSATTSVRPVPWTRQVGARWSARPVIRPSGDPGQEPRHGIHIRGPVSLTHEAGRLSGTVADEPVDLSLPLPVSSGEVVGSFAGVPVSGRWRLASNYEWAPDVPGWLGGSFGEDEVALRAWFHLDEGVIFDFGGVEGHVGESPVSAFARALVPGLPDGSFLVDGTMAAVGFSLRGKVNVGGGSLQGAVDGKPIALQVERDHPKPGSSSVSGGYEGPASLLMLVVAGLLFFA